jgi:mono/diheme cytochrome c family protein
MKKPAKPNPPNPVPSERGRIPALPEPPEPRDERGFIPVGLIGLLAVLGFLGDMYFINNGLDVGGKGGAFPKQVYFPYGRYDQVKAANPATGGVDLDAGKRIYSSICAACHQPNGMGTPGMFPPLAGSDWVNVEGHQRMIKIVLNGLSGPITVSGQQFNNVMVPLRDTLKDEDIANVISFVRQEWGNKGGPVTADEVKKVREETKDRGGSWTPDELKQGPE